MPPSISVKWSFERQKRDPASQGGFPSVSPLLEVVEPDGNRGARQPRRIGDSERSTGTAKSVPVGSAPSRTSWASMTNMAPGSPRAGRGRYPEGTVVVAPGGITTLNRVARRAARRPDDVRDLGIPRAG